MAGRGVRGGLSVGLGSVAEEMGWGRVVWRVLREKRGGEERRVEDLVGGVLMVRTILMIRWGLDLHPSLIRIRKSTPRNR